MNAAAEAVMRELPDLVLAYGNSDEFRYVESARGRPHEEIRLLRCAETS
jgi:tRNA(His) 5'-end guanylyltransferase